MSRSYYYLVAGLPDIVMEGNKNVPTVGGFIDDTVPQIHGSDAELLKTLLLPIDNANLISLLEKKGDFDDSGNFSREELEEEIKVPSIIPEYMQAFLEAHKEGRSIFSGLSPENQLTWLFYDRMASHGNSFVRDWFGFDCNLRNVLAGFNCRKAGKTDQASAGTLQSSILCRNDVAELILKSNAPDFSLGAVFPAVERLLSLDDSNLLEYEKGIDMIRWDTCNELTTFSYFQIETILAFTIKLGIVERWLRLDPEEGKKKLEKLVAELVSGFQFSEDFQ
ncbi:MAG: DUF2764 family protein [Chitinivibrionales bacterium]|nr:DUF2764 family protein [Chitinivibrionales bacterium]